MTPASTQAPPELPRQAIYPMRTQPRPLRVVYAVDADAFACAALADALALAAADGVGLALRLDERAAVGATAVAVGPVGDGGESGEGAATAVITAAWGHSSPLE